MRVFSKPNKSNGWKCPICKTDTDKEVVLIGIDGTENDKIVEAEQFHIECLELTWFKDRDIVAMRF